jgi:hypothetical protein
MRTTLPARRPKKRKPAALTGRDTYHVVGPEGELAVKGAAPHALTTAQERAMRAYTEPVTLTVERHALFGPVVTLYRVARSAHGVIRTHIIEPE